MRRFETLHPLVSVIDFSKATYQDRLPVGQIAYELGFGYPQYFSRLFRKRTGMTPKEYRKSIPF